MKEVSENLPGIPQARELTQLQAQMLRPAQAVNQDGSFELGWGTAILCFSLVPYFNAFLPKTVWASLWTAWIGYLPLICGAFAPYGIPKIIKRFFTWPRTGYVANPNEVKLKQLVMLMIFGGALGFSISLPLVLLPEIRAAMSHSGAPDNLPGIITHGIKLLICAGITIYLWPKVIAKRSPLPVAYDAALVNQALNQTTAGRKILRLVRWSLLSFFCGIPLLVCGLVFGLMYLSKPTMPRAEVHWPQLGFVSLIVAANALLYLMVNGVALRQHRWKWLVLMLLLVGPIVIAPGIPYPAVKSELFPIFQQFPPVALSIGLLWFLSGAATLIWFIEHHHLPTTEAL